MTDQYGRSIDYMRVSVTDRCNLRCKYCMPEGVPMAPMEELLTLEEIALAAETAAELGIRNFRLTGGEPLVRRGLPTLVAMIKAIPKAGQVTLTTNGLLLEKHLTELVSAGLDGVNISIDTLDRESYRQITGFDGLDCVLSAVDAAVSAGLRTKINAVSLDLGAERIKNLVELAKDRPVDVRFIEMMPIGLGKSFPTVSHGELLNTLNELYPDIRPDGTVHGLGPAVYYKIPGFAGGIGLISAIHGKFCDTCNRVRLTSMGYLKTCLCYNDGADLREIIRSDDDDGEKSERLRRTMREAIWRKPDAHCFDRMDDITEISCMNAIGG